MLKSKRVKVYFVMLIILVILRGIIWNSMENINSIKPGELISQTESPNRQYTLSVYRNSGGATTDWACLVTLTEKDSKKIRNLFWQNHREKVSVKWETNTLVKIDSQLMNVKTDTYDFRTDEKASTLTTMLFASILIAVVGITEIFEAIRRHYYKA